MSTPMSTDNTGHIVVTIFRYLCIEWNLDNEPLYNEVLDMTNDILRSVISKIYGKEALYNESSLQRAYFVSPSALRYFEMLYCF